VSCSQKPFAEIRNQVELKVSDATVRNVLADEGYHWWVTYKVPYLKREHKKDWIHWACKFKGFSENDWEIVIWSDEYYMYLGDNCGCIYVTCYPDKELHKEWLVPAFKQSTVHIMVWGSIMKGKGGPLIVLEYTGGKGGGMNSKHYQDQVLDGVLKGFYAQMVMERGSILFQQDRVPSHTSKSMKRWFSQNCISLLFQCYGSVE